MLKIREKKRFCKKNKKSQCFRYIFIQKKKIKKYTFQNQPPCPKIYLLGCSSSYTYRGICKWMTGSIKIMILEKHIKTAKRRNGKISFIAGMMGKNHNRYSTNQYFIIIVLYISGFTCDII